jgi:hypothetical protein
LPSGENDPANAFFFPPVNCVRFATGEFPSAIAKKSSRRAEAAHRRNSESRRRYAGIFTLIPINAFVDLGRGEGVGAAVEDQVATRWRAFSAVTATP